MTKILPVILSIICLVSCKKPFLPVPGNGSYIYKEDRYTPIKNVLENFLEDTFLDFASVNCYGMRDSILKIDIIERMNFDLYNPKETDKYWREDFKQIIEGPGFHLILLILGIGNERIDISVRFRNLQLHEARLYKYLAKVGQDIIEATPI